MERKIKKWSCKKKKALIEKNCKKVFVFAKKNLKNNQILRYILHNKVAQNTQDERVWDIFFTTLFNDYIGTNIEIIFTINIHTINMNLSIKHYNQK